MNRSGFSFRARGFTLVELSVSLAVILALTTILLWRYPETTMRLTLANMTHTTSLLIREAQIRGSAIDSINSSLGGYGVFFERIKPNKVVLFGDAIDSAVQMPYNIPIGDGIYQTGSPIDETKTTTTFSSGYVISKLCVGNGSPFTCNDANSPVINSLTISFTRPSPMPVIYINGSRNLTYPAACVELRSSRGPLSGHVRSVQVFNSGMIRTDVGKCDNSPL